MTTKADEDAMALIADMRHWASECSDDTRENGVRLTRSEVLRMADVFDHAREWRRLTEDPSTWPEEGQRIVWGTYTPNGIWITGEPVLFDPIRSFHSDYWFALPPPPEGEG